MENIDISNTRWYLSRLASMEPAEIVWRARAAARLPLDWALSKKKTAAPAPRWTPLQAASYPAQLHNSGSPMESIHVFDLEFPMGFEFDWHRNYPYGSQPERRFARTLHIPDTPVVPD